MAVGFKVKFYWYQIGMGGFLYSFFSTICYHLEDKNWGSKYKVLMNGLYQGEVKYENLSELKNEIYEIKEKLKGYSPDEVIWEIEDLTKTPPWEKNISKDITDLSNYFVTSSGEDLISILIIAIEKAMKLKENLLIATL